MATTAPHGHTDNSTSLRTEDDNGLTIITEIQKDDRFKKIDLQLDCPAYLNQDPSSNLLASPSSCKSSDHNGRMRTSALSVEARSLLRKSLLIESCSTHAAAPCKGVTARSAHCGTREEAEDPQTRNVGSEKSAAEVGAPTIETVTAGTTSAPTKATPTNGDHDPGQKSPLDGGSTHASGPEVGFSLKGGLELESTPEGNVGNNISVSDRDESGENRAKVNNVPEQQETTRGHKMDVKTKSPNNLSPPDQSLRMPRRTTCNPAVTSATSLRHHGKTGRRCGRTPTRDSQGKGKVAADSSGTAVAASQMKLSSIDIRLARAKCVPGMASKASEATVHTVRGSESPPNRSGRGRASRSIPGPHSRRAPKQGLSTGGKDSENTQDTQAPSFGSQIPSCESSGDKSRNARSITAPTGLMW